MQKEEVGEGRGGEKEVKRYAPHLLLGQHGVSRSFAHLLAFHWPTLCSMVTLNQKATHEKGGYKQGLRTKSAMTSS